MKNVYDGVRAFYEQDPAWNDIIRYELVEGFLRRKAWQHADDKRLRGMWQHVLMLGLYLAYADIPLSQAHLVDHEEMILWLERNVAEFKRESILMQRFFTTLSDFCDYLSSKGVMPATEVFSQAALELKEGRSILSVRPLDELPSLVPDAPMPIYLKLDEHLHELLLLLNKFYQRGEFLSDFERAVFLYHGIMGWDDEDLDSRRQDFWLGFWDYFLFDYRLIANDKTPLRNFCDIGDYPAEMATLLGDLVNARFSVFFVRHVPNEEWLECEDLLTGAIFFLPNPVNFVKGIKELLFMGHLFSDNMVLVNYVMSVPVSRRLRNRIKDETDKLLFYFRMQEPDASWGDFMRRNAVAIRHVVDIFTGYSKLNVVPELELPDFKRGNAPIRDVSVIALLCAVLKAGMFSFRDIDLCLRIWKDYLSLRDFAPRRAELWAAGVTAAFVDINSAFEVDYEYLADIFKVTPSQVREYKRYVVQALDIKEHDVRYLNEEGFVMQLLL